MTRLRTARYLLFLLCFAATWTHASPVLAQAVTYQELARFAVPYQPGSQPLVASNGTLYGVFTQGGGSDDGAIYSLTPDGAGSFTFAILHEFAGSDGSNPTSLMRARNGTLYGTTAHGGTNGWGTVFSMDASGVVQTLHHFGGGSDGATPRAALVEGADGNFYGTTSQGGLDYLQWGTVFKITSGGTYTTLYSFAPANGASPAAPLVEGKDGSLYGTASMGGADDRGTVFKITKSGTLTRLHSFQGSDGGYPSGGLTRDADGNFYGMTYLEGANNGGTLFRIDAAGTFTTLYNFTGIFDGRNPTGALALGADGLLYGVNTNGGANNVGALFSFDPNGSFATPLHQMAASDGAYPSAGLTEGTDGNLYGTSLSGGAHNAGTVFAVAPDGQFTKVLDVPVSAPAYAYTGLMRAADGMLYGTTGAGGAYNMGTVFRIGPTGAVTTMHDFNGLDGQWPRGTLMQGSDGNFYGTTMQGGAGSSGFNSGQGTVFRMTAAGVLTTLHSFSPVAGGVQPTAGLVEGGDGLLYGTTPYGSGSASKGTIFRISPAGSLTMLHEFSGPDGELPSGSLVKGPDGALYGTTAQGGAEGVGTAFKIDSAGTFTTLHDFMNSEGAYPVGLQLGSDGMLYGATTFGANGSQNGTLFKMSGTGTVTTLFEFHGTDGASVSGPPILGSDGLLYGTTYLGGVLPGDFFGAGTVFRLETGGTLTTLHTFGGRDGSGVNGPLVQGSDGRFYGTTFAPAGVVFAVGIDGINHAPVADSQSVSTPQDTAAVITLTASDADGDLLTYTVQQPAHGTVTGAGPSLTYTPAAGYHGPDVFTFTVNDGRVNSSAATISIVVTPSGVAQTATTLTPATRTVGFLQAVSFTATVAAVAPATGTPSGAVQFVEGTVVLGTAPLVGGTATLALNGLDPGVHTIRAVYTGTPAFAGSTSAAATLTIQGIGVSTFTALIPWTNPQAAGQPAVFSAYVQILGVGLVSSGAVGFAAISDAPGGPQVTQLGAATVTNGLATISTTALAPGVYTIAALYLGAAPLLPSLAPPIRQTIYSGARPIATATAITVAPAQSTAGQSVTITATVGAASGAPSGAVEFYADNVKLGTANLVNTGGTFTATFSTATLPVGLHVLSASYVGGGGFSSSNAALIPQSVR